MAYFVAEEETLDREGLALLQRDKLADMLADVLATNEFYKHKLAGIRFDPRSDPMDRLGFTTRDEIQQDQIDHPLYGTNLTYPMERYARLHQTSGSTGTPLRWLDTFESWRWWYRCWGILYRAAGVKPGDRLFFPVTFGPFIGWWGAFEGATALGNMALSGGGMTTLARLEHLLAHQITFVCCTPSYALRMAEVAVEEGIDLPGSSVRGLIVAGEPGGSIPATRARMEEAWGARVFDHAGQTEVGPWGFECEEAPVGGHAMESEFIVESIDSATGEPVADGELGELVVTNLGRWGSPLIRYRTGDQARLIRKRCACGRWFARLEGGILGRSDDMLLVRGNNVFPSAVEGIVREFREVAEFSMEAVWHGSMADLNIAIEPVAGADANGLTDRVTRRFRDRLHFRPHVTLVKPGSLPRFDRKAKRLTHRDRPT